MKYSLCILALLFSTPALSEQFIRGTIGDNFVEGVFTVGGEYNRWSPLNLQVLDVQTNGYEVGHVALGLKFKKFAIPKLKYETTLGGSKQDEVVKVQKTEGEHAKYEKFIGVLTYRTFTFKYNKETYISDVTALGNFIYIPREGLAEQVLAGQHASFATQFESYSILKKVKSFNLGIFYSTYTKPYFFTEDDVQLTEYLWNAEFISYGLEISKTFQTTFRKPVSTLVEFKSGIGDIDFGQGVALSDIIPEDDSLLFWEFNLAPQWSKILNENTTMNLAAEASWKQFFFSSESAESAESDGKDINKDFTLKFLASVSYKF